MSTNVVELTAVSKRYGGNTLALNELDLAVPTGGVFGLIGPNGSGKTTTLRVLLGLARATSGTATLLGQPVPNGLGEVRSRIGALVETPKFYPRYSGRLNLELLAGLKGVDRSHVDVVIERVGLAGREQDNFGGYSLGMRQRLAVAGAMLGDPELLILDEPANGLDPAGIAAMRDMLAAFGKTGRTVLVSSHHLADVERISDQVAVVARGRVVASGTVAEVAGDTTAVRVVVREPMRAAMVLTDAGFTVQPPSSDRVAPPVSSAQPDAVPQSSPVVPGEAFIVMGADGESVARALGAHDIFPSELSSAGGGLEAAYLRLTGIDPLAGGDGGIAGTPANPPFPNPAPQGGAS